MTDTLVSVGSESSENSNFSELETHNRLIPTLGSRRRNHEV